MKVLVTGGTSMLGAGVAKALQARGDEVTVMQRGSSDLDVAEIRGDVAEPRDCINACRGQDAVIHLAANVSVAGDWPGFHRVNVAGTGQLVDAARAAGASSFVQVSSPSVAHAGAPLVGAPADPADPEHARGHYARSKALAERLALAAADDAFAVVAVRPHLVWGPGDTQLVGRIVERAKQGRLLLIGGGTALVDSTYVDNAVTALVAALDRAADISGRAFVVTNGEPRTVAELLTRICRSARVPEPRRSVPAPVATAVGAVVERAWSGLRRDDEPPMTRFLAEQLATAHWFDQRAAREALQWQPHVSLEEGFDRLADAFDQAPA